MPLQSSLGLNALATGSLVLLAALLRVVLRLWAASRRSPGMPPGPPTIPFLGNAHQLPLTGIAKKFQEWSKEYGTVYSVKLGPGTAIVICERQAVHDLIDKKGAIYADRPKTFAINYAGLGSRISLRSSADSTWRLKRRIVAHNLSPKQLDEKHYRIQEAEATVMMNDLLRSPQDAFHHVKRYAASVATVIVYGHRAPCFENFWCKTVYEMMERRSAVLEPGATPPADDFPILQHIPTWMAPWKKRLQATFAESDELWARARGVVNERRSSGDKRNSIADNLLDEYEQAGWPMSQYDFDHVLGEMVEGGADTTASSLLTIVLALAKHPHVQKRAREEIDRICGTERGPAWKDFEDLPYVNAVVKEALRWRPVAPIAIMHRNSQDDTYKGMFIPKGSTIFICTWAIHHSDEYYKNAGDFNPDRYLNHPKLASEYAGSPDWNNRDESPKWIYTVLSSNSYIDHYAYGAGRRVCPGIHLAERSLWRVAAKFLWAFDFAEPVDEKTGKTISLDDNAYTPGFLHMPLPYEVHVKVRSDAHLRTIEKELAVAMADLRSFD